MSDITTYYVALPFLQDDTGTLVPGAAEECQSPTTALRRADAVEGRRQYRRSGIQPQRRSDGRRVQRPRSC